MIINSFNQVFSYKIMLFLLKKIFQIFLDKFSEQAEITLIFR